MLRPFQRWACPVCLRLAEADEDAPTSRLLCEHCGTTSPGAGSIPPLPTEAVPTPDLSAVLDPRSYTLLEPLGAGGMGEVYRGLDPSLSRDLAVKVMRVELRGDADAEGRFLREARITGALEHPGVVPVHSLGRLPDGRLYLTMKLVRGRTLDRLLAEHPEPHTLVGHFEKVCQAVAYAHSQGIIHRDLKPQNIIIGEFGEVQVMDWGLAKRLRDQEKTTDNFPPLDEAATRSGRVMGTPAFMPPEQARGLTEQVDQRADVFSLGAILCVILTGRPPYVPSEHQDVLSQASRGDLSKASARLAGCGADSELIALCRDCLAAAPDGRPRDAAAVARRLAQYQDGVRDRLRQAELERSRSQVREEERRKRRRLAAGLLALLVAGLAVGLWAVAREQRRTAAALADAEGNLKLARQAIDEGFNVAVNDPLFQRPRMEQARRRLLEKTLPFYARFRDKKPDDPSVRRDEALQLGRVAFIEKELGRLEPALESYRKTLELQRQLVRDHPQVTEYKANLADTHDDLAILLSRQKRYEEALAEAKRAGALWRALIAASPAVPAYRSALAAAHNIQAVQLASLGKEAEAEEEYRRACEVGEELVKSHPDALDYQSELARPYLNLGTLLMGQGRREEAALSYRRTIELRLRLVKARPDVAEYQSLLATVHSGLGHALESLGRDEEALKELREAYRVQSAVAKANPDLPALQAEMARVAFNLGHTLERLERYGEAREVYSHSRDRWLELANAFPDRPEYRKSLADTRTNLGVVLYNMNRFEEASREYRQGQSLLAPLHRADTENTDYTVSLARACVNHGQAQSRLGRPLDALPVLNEGIALLYRVRGQAAAGGEVKSLLVFGLPQRAAALLRLGRTAEADADWERLLALGPPEERLGRRVTRAEFRARAGDHRRAAEEADELGREPTLTANTLYDLACVHALSALASDRDTSRPLPERERLAEGYARKAMDLLRRAADAGRFRDPARVDALNTDADLTNLRNRDDFRGLVAELRRKPLDR